MHEDEMLKNSHEGDNFMPQFLFQPQKDRLKIFIHFHWILKEWKKFTNDITDF